MKQGAKSRQWTFEEALALVCNEEQPLSSQVIAFLSGPGRAQVARFAECWRRMSEERRRRLISEMVDMAEADYQMDFNAIFRWALQSEDPLVRERAIDGLWEDEQPGLIEPLLRMMKGDPEAGVRARAAMLLGRFALLSELGDISEDRAARVRNGLLEVIEDPEEVEEVRRRAIESVAYLTDAPVREIIEEAYDSADERMRLSAVFAMGRTADPHWSQEVRAELHAPDAAMRYEAARAAGEIGARSAVGEVIALLADPDSEVRQMAVWALGQIGGPQARRALEVCQSSPDEAMRDATEDALAELDFGSAPLDMFYYDEGKRPEQARLPGGEGEPEEE